MNSLSLKSNLFLFLFILSSTGIFAQSVACDGSLLNAGLDSRLCFAPNGGTVDFSGTASPNVIGFVWSDNSGEIARDNLSIEDYFVSETTTITLSGFVISDNQIVDGDFGTGDDFENGFPPNYQGSFATDFQVGPFATPPTGDDIPDRGDAGFVSPLEENGSYIVTDDAFNGGFGFTTCFEPSLQGGNIAVFNLGADRDRVICTRVQLTAGNEYTFAVEVATVGEVTYDDSGTGGGPPNGEEATEDPMGDIDGDGFPNGDDCCPYATSPFNDDCSVCEIYGMPDADGDGFPDAFDNCPFVFNPEQDLAVCSTRDADGDEVEDWQDNCVDVFNPGQEDRNGDGIGDACEEEGPGGPGPGEIEGYCIPFLELELQGVNNQNTVIGPEHQSELEFCVWTDMVRTFTANVSGEVELCLMSTCPFSGGNLLGIDNLQFSETCRFSDEVTVFVDDISANILPVQPLDCNTDGVLLEGEWDANYEDINSIQFFWFEDTQGTLVDGATEEDYFVEEPGTYNFSVLNEETGCFAVFPVEVIDNFSSPEAVIEFPDTLSCANEIVVLDASASAGGANDETYTYEWNGVFGGEFLDGDPADNSPIQEVVGSGTYELLVTNTFNGCTSSTIIFVEENVSTVELETVESNFELGCDVKAVEFEVDTTLDPDTDQDDIVYVWTLDADTILTSNVFESPLADVSGTYQLVVTNLSSGCTDELSFEVTGESTGPEIIVPDVSERITCDNQSVDLTATVDDANGVTFAWTNSNGDNLSPNGELSPTVFEPGTYTFTAIDNVSGCEAVQEVVVEGSVMDPTFSIGIPSAFDCRIGEVELMGLLSDPTGNYTFVWMDESNQVVGNDINLSVQSAGAYTLSITDTDNGCSRPVTINVFDNSAEPQINLTQNQNLNCTNTTAEIVANTSEDNLSYVWSTQNGSIMTDNGSSITVDMGGNYLVTVTDEDTGCTTETSIELQSNFDAPNFEASTPNNISCDNTSSNVFVNDFGTGLTYAWTASNGGAITGGVDTNNPTFGAAGDYTVMITNPNSGCAVEQTFSITGNTIEPEIQIAGGGQLGCEDVSLPVSVNLLNPAIQNVDIAWSSNNGGAFLGPTNIANPSVTAAGTYQVVVTNVDNGCTAIQNIEITQDNDKPEIDIASSNNIDCVNASVVLNASGSTVSNDFNIQWTSNNGAAFDNANILTPTVTQAGTYTLTITNPSNGCSSEASVTIAEDNSLPIVDLPAELDLSCDVPSFVLGGGSSSAGTEFQYQWFDQSMNPVPGANNITLDVSESGSYTLEIINATSGCSDSRTVIVNGNADLPEVDAGSSLELNCTIESDFLSGTAPANATLVWTTTDGNIINGANTLNPEINAEGTYILTATIPSTGCEASSSITVLADMSAPIIEVETPEALNCVITSISVDATGSTTNGVSILWTNLNNNPITNENTLTPEFTMPGEYVLTITDDATGCVSQEVVNIEEVINEPAVNLETEVRLDCDVSSSFIGEVDNPNYTYAWTSTSGQFESTSAQIEVSDADIYNLVVTDILSGCEATYSVEVISDVEATDIVSLTADMISCVNQFVTPVLEINSGVSEVSIVWTTFNGTIDSGATTVEPIITSAGEYTVEITNLTSGCVTTQQLVIDANNDEPEFALGADLELSCGNSVLEVGIELGQQNSDFEYTWTDAQGNTLSNDGLIDIENQGTYILEVVNTLNGCSFTDQIQVSENINAPEISAGENQIFRCGDTQVALNGTILSNLNNFDIQWETDNGRIVEGDDSLNPIVSQPGTYTLVLTNLENQCSASEEVLVSPDMDAPTAIIETTGDLTCNVTSITLSGENSQGNGNLFFTWLRDGVELSSDVGEITVNTPGSYDLVVLDMTNNCSTTTSTTIELFDQEPNFTIIKPSDLDCDINEIILSSDHDTNSDLSFTWSTSDGNIVSPNNISTPTINASGTYMLTIVDNISGCFSTQTILVEQDGDVPTFALEVDNELNCTASEVNIIADIQGGNVDLVWTDLATGAVIDNSSNILSVAQAGNYQLEVTDMDNLCSSVRSIEVVENTLAPILDALQPLALNCDVQSTIISAELVNEIVNASINWSTQDGTIGSADLNTLEIEVLSGGTYTFEVINADNGCSNSIDIIVPENADTPIFGIANVDNITCDNPDVTISALIGNQSNNQVIEWTTPNGNIIGAINTADITVDEEGEYTIRIEDAISGCSDEQTVFVFLDADKPVLTIDNPLELNCTQLEVSLTANVSNASNVDISWLTTNGSLTGPQNELNTSVDMPGEYIVVVSNLDNGCTEEQSIIVGQNIEIPEVQVDEAEELTCRNEVVLLSGQTSSIGTIDLNWTTTNGNIIGSANSSTIEVDLPGTYVLALTDAANNCTNSANVTVEQNQDVPTSFDAFVSQPLCYGDLGSINIIEVEGGVGPYNYSIDGNEFDPNSDFDQLEPGAYTLTVMDIEECTYEETIVVPSTPELTTTLIDQVDILLGQSNQIVVNTNVQTSQISSITWTPSDFLSCDDCLTPTASPNNDISYFVTIENANGCIVSDSIQFRVQRLIGVYTPNAFSPNGDFINDTFTIYSKEDAIVSVSNLSIYDRWGTQVFQNEDFPANDESFGWDGSYKGETLQPDVFIYKARVLLVTGETELISGNVTLIK